MTDKQPAVEEQEVAEDKVTSQTDDVVSGTVEDLPPGFSRHPPQQQEKAAVEITFEGIKVTTEEPKKKKKSKSVVENDSKSKIKKKKKKEKEDGSEKKAKKKKKVRIDDSVTEISEVPSSVTEISEVPSSATEISEVPSSAITPTDESKFEEDVENYDSEPSARRVKASVTISAPQASVAEPGTAHDAAWQDSPVEQIQTETLASRALEAVKSHQYRDDSGSEVSSVAPVQTAGVDRLTVLNDLERKDTAMSDLTQISTRANAADDDDVGADDDSLSSFSSGGDVDADEPLRAPVASSDDVIDDDEYSDSESDVDDLRAAAVPSAPGSKSAPGSGSAPGSKSAPGSGSSRAGYEEPLPPAPQTNLQKSQPGTQRE